MQFNKERSIHCIGQFFTEGVYRIKQKRARKTEGKKDREKFIKKKKSLSSRSSQNERKEMKITTEIQFLFENAEWFVWLSLKLPYMANCYVSASFYSQIL